MLRFHPLARYVFPDLLSVKPADGDEFDVVVFELLRDAFGVVALVAMAPLITIQLLGFRGIIAERRAERRAMKKILDADDQQIINFM